MERREGWSPWVARVAWVGVFVFGWSALEAVADDASTAVATTIMVGGAAMWAVAVAALVFPSVPSLTLARSMVPLSVFASMWAWWVGGDTTNAGLALVCSLIAAAATYSAGTGRAFVQASAYGSEQRFPLRPPLAYLIVSVIAWAIVAASWLTGPLLLADRQWLLGGVVTALAVLGALWSWPRWHRLSRRWFVVVPAGLVVHDQLVLAETLMLRRAEVAGVQLAPADTEAADLTGPSAGHALQISTDEAVTAILAASPSSPRGQVIHLTAALVSPSRPGAALGAATRSPTPQGV